MLGRQRKQEAGVKKLEPRIKKLEPRPKNQEPRAKNQEPSFKSVWGRGLDRFECFSVSVVSCRSIVKNQGGRRLVLADMEWRIRYNAKDVKP